MSISLSSIGANISDMHMGTALMATLPLAYIQGQSFMPGSLLSGFVDIGGSLILAETVYAALLDIIRTRDTSNQFANFRIGTVAGAAGITGSAVVFTPGLSVDMFPELASIMGSAYSGPRFFSALAQGEGIVAALKSALGM